MWPPAADVTVATIEMDAAEAAKKFGVHGNRPSTGESWDSRKSRQSRSNRRCIPDKINASMGVYLFNTQLLVPILIEDAENPASSHDFGKDILPRILRKISRVCLQFSSTRIKRKLRIGATWERSTHTTKPTWIWCR